jgi:hypothetical protein
MKYNENLDYIIAAITYLGTHTYYWARTPKNMSSELSLDEKKLTSILTGFPGIFRRSRTISKEYNQNFFSLQARLRTY